MALSASGAELAMALTPAQPGLPARVLQIYSVTTGKLERTWSTSDKTAFAGSFATVPGMAATTPLTWVDDDRALAFPLSRSPGQERKEATHETVRLLDMSAGGSDLIADSRVIWTESSQPRSGSSQLAAGDGADAHRRREDDRVPRTHPPH